MIIDQSTHLFGFVLSWLLHIVSSVGDAPDLPLTDFFVPLNVLLNDVLKGKQLYG